MFSEVGTQSHWLGSKAAFISETRCLASGQGIQHAKHGSTVCEVDSLALKVKSVIDSMILMTYLRRHQFHTWHSNLRATLPFADTRKHFQLLPGSCQLSAANGIFDGDTSWERDLAGTGQILAYFYKGNSCTFINLFIPFVTRAIQSCSFKTLSSQASVE